MIKVLVDIEKNLSSRDALFKSACQDACKNKILNKENIDDVVNAFIKRENEFSTALDDDFAIPHAVSNKINEPCIVFFRNKKGIQWDENKKSIKQIIFLFIPEKDRQSSHMDIISSIATSLLDESVRSKLMKSKNVTELKKIFDVSGSKETENKSSSNSVKDSKGTVLCITACPVGVAHTYLAAEKLQDAITKQGYTCFVETHGSVGVKGEFTSKQLSQADLVIIASDIGIDTNRFAGKKVYKTKVKEAVDKPAELFTKALKDATVVSGSNGNSKTFEDNTKDAGIVKHLMTGVSYMIPFIIFGGLMIAISLGLQKAIYGYEPGQAAPANSFLWYIEKFGGLTFSLMIAVLGGFIANSIAGRAAIAPAMIVSFLGNEPSCIYPLFNGGNQTPLGFIGAILFGLLIGYTVKWMNSWKIHKNISSLMPIFIIPVGLTLIYTLLMTFVIGAPISFIMNKIGEGFKTIFVDNDSSSVGVKVGIGIGMGLLIGAMAGFDMGGPINKIAFVVCSSLVVFSDPALGIDAGTITQPMGMMAAAIPVAPLGMGISTLVYKKKFNEEQKSMGISAIVMGTIGISEGAIPFAIADPKRVFVSNIVGSAVAGAIAGALGVTDAVAHGGPIVGMLGAVGGSFIGEPGGTQTGLGIAFFFLAIIAGTIVTVLMYGLMMKLVKDNVVTNEEVKVSKFATWKHNTKASYNNSGFHKYVDSNRKVIAFSIMTVISLTLLIVGITLTTINADAIGNMISNASKVVENSAGDPSNLFVENGMKVDTQGVYGIFGLISGFFGALFTFIYSFTVFKKEKPQLNG